MRSGRNLSYPHPVLTNFSEDVEGEYCPKVKDKKITFRDEVIVVPLQDLHSENRTIRSLVEEDKARIVMRFDCPRTFVRSTYTTLYDETVIKLPADHYYRTVRLHVKIILTEELSDYLPEGHHPHYENYPFDLVSGQVLAIGDKIEFHAEKKFDALKAPVSSFFQIVKDDDLNDEEPYRTSFEDEKITVHMDEETFGNYQDLAELSPSTLHSSLVYPVLVEAIRKVEEYSDQKWAERLEQILNERDLLNRPAEESAQLLLDLPLNRTARSLRNLGE